LNSLEINKEVFIPKLGNSEKNRPLDVLAVEDRIVQQSFLSSLKTVFEKTFSDRSHGFKPKKGYERLRKIKSTVCVEVRLYHLRNADDWLIGLWGFKNAAVKIRQKIKIVFSNALELQLPLGKIKITHADKEKVYFLG